MDDDRSLLGRLELERALSEAGDLKSGLGMYLETALRVSGLDCGGIYLRDIATGSLELTVHLGLPDLFVSRYSQYPADAPETMLVMAGQSIFGRHDVLDELAKQVKADEGLKALAVVPITWSGRVLGCLNLGSRSIDEIPGAVRIHIEAIALKIGAELAEARTRLDLTALFDEGPSYLVVVDGRDRILTASPFLRQALGLSEAEIKGLPATVLFPDWTGQPGNLRASTIRTFNGTVAPTEQRIVPGQWEGEPVHFVVGRDLRTQRVAEGQEVLRVLFSSMSQGVVFLDAAGRIVDANRAAEEILGLTVDQMRGRTSLDARWRAIREDGSEFPGQDHPAMTAIRTGQQVRNVLIGVYNPLREELRWINVSATPRHESGREDPIGAYTVFEDVTARRQVEYERQILLDVLQLVNTPGEISNLISQVTLRLREWSGCEAAGIRLATGQDFPYYGTSGFPPEFVQREGTLLDWDGNGKIRCGADGTPALACICGQVLRGDPSPVALKSNGSFWTNCASDLISGLTQEQLEGLRGHCFAVGYESIALVPLRAVGQTFGLLQFNDKRKNRFDDRRIAMFEKLAGDLALGLAQRSTEAALRQSEDQFRTLFEHTQSGVAIHEVLTGPQGEAVDYRFLKVNPAFARQTGLAAEDIEGRLVTQVLPDIKTTGLIETYGRVAATGESIRFEYESPDLARTFDISAFSPKPGQFATVVLDVSDRKKREEALRQSEKEKHTLIENIPGAVYRYDTTSERVLSHLSNGVQEITGLPAHKFLSREERWRDRIVSEDLDRYFRTIDTAIAERRTFEQEYRVLHADGSERWVHDKGQGIYSPAGDLVSIDGVIIDVSERKQAEQALRESQERLELAMDATSEGVWDWNLRTNKVHFSSQWLRGLGYDPGDGDGSIQFWRQTIHPEDMEPVEAVLRAHLRGETPAFECENRRRKKSGEYRYNLDRGKVVERSVDGVPLRMVGTSADITERKAMEARLAQAEKMESVGRLAGGVAHDFNNLLTVINGYSQLLLGRVSEEDPLRPGLTEVRNAGQRAASLTQQLLAFSRRQVLSPDVLDLNAIVKDTERMLRRLIGEDFVMTTQLDPELGHIVADPGQINQVLVNLAVNARDAMQPGGTLLVETGNVEIDESQASAHPGCTAGRWVRLALTDSGAGMDSETQRHLFEPFFTTKKQGLGTGLGLPTVYGIVKQSGGWISVKSKPGNGSTFSVYLPRVERTVTAVRPDADRTLEVLRGSETVLIVEDQDDVRMLAASILDNLGYRVLTAASGVDALALLAGAENPIQVLLTDVVMPGMNGRDLAARVQARSPGTRILYMSGYTDDVIARNGIEERRAAFLQKPFTTQQLAQSLRALLDMPAGQPRG